MKYNAFFTITTTTDPSLIGQKIHTTFEALDIDGIIYMITKGLANRLRNYPEKTDARLDSITIEGFQCDPKCDDIKVHGGSNACDSGKTEWNELISEIDNSKIHCTLGDTNPSFKIGDVVCFKGSTNMPMTVTYVENENLVQLSHFDKDGNFIGLVMPKEALTFY